MLWFVISLAVLTAAAQEPDVSTSVPILVDPIEQSGILPSPQETAESPTQYGRIQLVKCDFHNQYVP